MFKKYIFLLASLFVWSSHSQNDKINFYQIEYKRYLTFDDATEPYISNYVLNKFVSLNKSIFDKKSKIENEEQLIEDENDDTILTYSPKGKKNSMVYKDYTNSELYSKHEVSFKYFVVQDNLEIFDWEILEETKVVSGYKCQKAIMDFRGRAYSAWFSSELPVGGPWKYDGLPGLIMEIESDDGFIKFEVVSITNSNKEINSLKNPFNIRSKLLNWQEFTDLYKKKAIELLSYRASENAKGIESSLGGIEFYIMENDEEYNKALENFKKQ